MSSTAGSFLRRSLRRRIVFLLGLGMLPLAAVLLAAAVESGRELSDRALRERLHVASATADHLDYVLKSNLAILQEAALAARAWPGAPAEELRAPLRTALRDAWLRSAFTAGVFLTDRTGALALAEPQEEIAAREALAGLASMRAAVDSGKPEVSGLVTDGERRRLYAAVPVRDWSGTVVGAVGGAVDPENPRFRSLLHPIRMGETAYLDVVDGRGRVLASTKSGRAFSESDHGEFMAGLIREKRSAVSACHSCHEQSTHPAPEVMAFAPLQSAPWGVSIRQEESEALASVVAMRRRLALVGAAIMLLALVFAWGVARSVTAPIGVLTRAAQSLAGGDLDGPIPPLGIDEIGRLARAFDSMRTALRDSRDEIECGKRELEQRVQQRTRELERLYGELRRKEEARHELLKKVINAQEAERKRIARELHDETSQASTALLLAIDAGGRHLSEESREGLRRMKRMADRVLASVHGLIYDLRPSMLDDLGPVPALRAAAESRLEHMGIDLSFEVLGPERRLPAEVETTVFRIGQEAIANIARHAEAEAVKISIEFGDRSIRLSVEDDGGGFDPAGVEDSAPGGRGLGLLGMKERAALLGGALRVESAPGRGTRIAADIPVEPAGAPYGVDSRR